MAVVDHTELAPVVRDAVASGDFSAFGELLAADAVLDTSNESGRVRIEGPEAIIAHLSKPGPGDLEHWEAREWPTGIAATFEWHGASGVDRRRWYVRREGEGITAIWSYAARAAGDAGATIPDQVLALIGSGARREPLAHGGNSGAALERVTLADGTGLIAKRVGPASDWLGRVTRDRGRTALLWDAGVFDRLPASLGHGIEAVVADGDGWWVVMRDLSATFLGDQRRLSRDESRRILGVAAQLHAEFAGEKPDGAATLADRIGMTSLRVADAEQASSDLLPKQLPAAWDAFAESVPAEVGDEVMAAVADPGPLAAALEHTGRITLIHGDLRDDNLGLTDDQVILLDWDLAAVGTPTVEFAWYLVHDAWRIDGDHDRIEADYRAAEADSLDERELELGILSGLVMYGWIFGHSLRVHPDPAERAWAAAELGWWVPRTRRALEATGGMPR